METQKDILKTKRGYIPVCIIVILSTLFLTIPKAAHSAVYIDAYSYEDSFEDTSGLNPEETHGFEVSNGDLEAMEAPAVAVSECISLPQPEGGTFQTWSFLNISLSELGTGSNTLEIRDCTGATLHMTGNLPEGETTIDLSSITAPSIRLVWMTDQAGAKLRSWGIYGKSDGVTSIRVTPSTDTVDAGDTVTFTIGLSTSGARARGPVLRFSLDAINGLHTPDIDDGLAEDAEVDYGSGVNTYRPLGFVSATNGPKGELPAKPESGATSGEVVWTLDDLSDGFLDNVAVTLRVPKGYINGKTLAGRAVLEHGVSSGGYSNRMIEEYISQTVMVNSISFYAQYITTAYGNLGPGAPNIYDVFYYNPYQSYGVESPSDIEDITVTITGTGTCAALFRNVGVICDNPSQVIGTPETGAPITTDDPVIVHIDRAHFYHFSISVYIYYDVPNDCPDKSNIVIQSRMAVGNPEWEDTDSVTHNVVIEVCRTGYNLIHRIMSGNDPGSYNIWPGWPEYYIYPNGSLRAGEYFTTWAPYGNAGQRSHTVPLDHSYDLIEIPGGITFHGVREANELDRLYKDCTGTAPGPEDPAFDHDADPPHSAWNPVDITWKDAPFSSPPDENDPEAVVLEGCRLLGIKDTDSPADQGDDRGNWYPLFLWHICDGSFGCPELPDGTAMSLIGGRIFTYETYTDPAGAVHDCCTYGGWQLYKEEKSWPKVHTWPEENQVPAAQIAHIILNPENDNKASQWVDGRWAVNLYRVRDYIDLQGVTGEVLTEGLNIPKPDQNITGEGCSIQDGITFHFPDPAGCKDATSEDDVACMAWWEVPPACQPPNGWGYRINGNHNQDEFTQIYRFRLNAPILSTTPANTKLDFVAEVRTKDLYAKGADNVVDPARWPAENYSTTASVTVLDLPGLDVAKAGPYYRKPGDTLTYTLEATNYGNTPNDGWYLVDWLPKQGINSSEFTPLYGRVYLDRMPEDCMVEYTDNAPCFTDPQGCVWIEMPLQETERTGYNSETLSPIDANATCVRIRRRPMATTNFNPADTISAAIDVIIPDDITLEGKRIYNRGLAGASNLFGSASDLPPIETINVRTTVSSEISVGMEKGFETDPARAGWVKWMLRVHNTSGEAASNISIVDELPANIKYKGTEGAIPEGWSIQEEPAMDEQGGSLHIIIQTLAPDDGNPGTGSDEGEIAFWSRVKEGIPAGAIIQNCATATPEYGTGGQGCARVIIPDLTISKAQDANDRIHSTQITEVFPRDIIRYTITAVNSLDQAVFLKVHDELDAPVAYIPGSFMVNGAQASDSFISQGVLDYPYPAPVNPGKTLILELEVRVRDNAPNNSIIANTAQVSACEDLLDPSGCFVTLETIPVYDMVLQPCEGDFDGDGDVDGSDLAIFATDFGRTDCPILD